MQSTVAMATYTYTAFITELQPLLGWDLVAVKQCTATVGQEVKKYPVNTKGIWHDGLQISKLLFAVDTGSMWESVNTHSPTQMCVWCRGRYTRLILRTVQALLPSDAWLS